MRRATLPPDHQTENLSSDTLLESHSNYRKALDDFYDQNFRGLFEKLSQLAESLRTEISYALQYPNGPNIRDRIPALSGVEYYLNAPYLSSKINLFQSLYHPVIEVTTDLNNLLQSFQYVKVDPKVERAIDLEEKLALLQAKVEMSIAERKDFYDKEYRKKPSIDNNPNGNKTIRRYDSYWMK